METAAAATANKTTPVETSFPGSAAARLISLDVYRGFVMLLMASEGFGLPRIAKQFKDHPVWQFLGYQFDHVTWTGCALWDLIQPSFMFMVGVALPYSIASRRAKGDGFGRMFGHAIWRSLLLISLGIFLRSVGSKQTYFTFEDVLSQIGLGYSFLFLLGWAKPRIQAIAAMAILVVYWALFAFYPLAPAGFDWTQVGVPATWNHLQGFAAHWEKNFNFSNSFDQWFLNLFPREKPFVYNGGGYLTLSFIPSLVTMIFGLLAGNLLRSKKVPLTKFWWLAGAGCVGLLLGEVLDLAGICPIVKRIWTPSWAIFSAGWTCLMLAGFYWVIDLRKRQRWAFPLLIVGMNSIAMYLMAHLFYGFIRDTAKTHLGSNWFAIFGTLWAPLFQSVFILLVLWLMCLWLYRRRIFLKV